jgi:hypothetical protein
VQKRMGTTSVVHASLSLLNLHFVPLCTGLCTLPNLLLRMPSCKTNKLNLHEMPHLDGGLCLEDCRLILACTLPPESKKHDDHYKRDPDAEWYTFWPSRSKDFSQFICCRHNRYQTKVIIVLAKPV